MKPRPEVNKDYKPTPYCRGSNECSCFSAYFGYGDGPTGCSKHSDMVVERCVQCGRYFKVENPNTCTSYKAVIKRR